MGNLDSIVRAIRAARLFESGAGTLVSPSRLVQYDGEYWPDEPNQYSQPISSVFPLDELRAVSDVDELLELAEERGRYVGFNVLPLDRYTTIEIRMHSGTLEARKIGTWISLWMQILWFAEKSRVIPDVPDVDVVEPSDDIVELARAFLPGNDAFRARLAERRSEVVALWGRHEDLSPWLAFVDEWDDGPNVWQPDDAINLVTHLEQHGFQVTDKRGAGGALWVHGPRSLDDDLHEVVWACTIPASSSSTPRSAMVGGPEPMRSGHHPAGCRACEASVEWH